MEAMNGSDIKILKGVSAHLRNVDCNMAADILDRAIEIVRDGPAQPRNEYQKLVSLCEHCKELPGEWQDNPHEADVNNTSVKQFICDSCLGAIAEEI